MDALAIKNAAGAANGLPTIGRHAGDRAAMRQAAEDFEAQFLGQMFQLAMRDKPVDEVFGGGAGERMFRDLLTDAWAGSAAKAGGLGIADAVMRTLIEAQGR